MIIPAMDEIYCFAKTGFCAPIALPTNIDAAI
jgi:hypothetical protein